MRVGLDTNVLKFRKIDIVRPAEFAEYEAARSAEAPDPLLQPTRRHGVGRRDGVSKRCL